MGARRGRPTTRLERLRGARAFRRRNPSRRCGGTTRLGRDERFVVPSRAFTGSLHTGTGTGTGTGSTKHYEPTQVCTRTVVLSIRVALGSSI